jgi:hypothetical protein
MKSLGVYVFIGCWLVINSPLGAGPKGLLRRAEAFAQNDACMAELKSIYKKYKDITATGIPKDKVYYMNYSVNTATEDSTSTGILTSVVETWMDKENLEVRSKEMEVYQNGKEAFIVFPAKKMVVHNDAVSMDAKKTGNKVKRMQFIQDTLFSMSRISFCGNVNSTNGIFKRVVLQVNDKGRTMTNIGKITFDINEKTKEFESIKIQYSPKSKGLPGDVVWVEYVFNDVSFDYKGKEWPDNLSKNFLRSSSQLKEKYTGYELVDNRKKVVKIPQ